MLIRNNPILSDIQSLVNVSKIDVLDIKQNPFLTSLDGLEGVSWWEEVRITENENLTNYCALNITESNSSLLDIFIINDNLFNPNLNELLGGNCSE